MCAQADNQQPADSATEAALSWRGLRVAVTGGAGFIGAALVRELVRQGAEVVAVDVAPFDRLAHLDGHRRLRTLTADVRDRQAMADGIAGCALVLHLAGVVGVQRYLADPLRVIEVNLDGTRSVAEACRIHGCALVLASTSEVYGTLGVDLREGAAVQLGDLHGPRWSYALSKATAEQVTLAYARAGLAALVVRYFNVYGPDLDAPGEGRVLSQFLGQLAAGQPLRLVDGGHAVRSFCYIDDAVEATLRLAARLLTDQQCHSREVCGAIVNVGRREPVTMAELAECVLRLSGAPVGTAPISGEQHFGPGFEEIPRRVPVLAKLERLTGYVAPTPLEVGVGRVLAHWGMARSDGVAAPARAVVFVRPDVAPDPALLASVARILTSGRLTNCGPEVVSLEREIGQLTGTEAVVAASSGFAALALALHLTRPADARRDVVVLPAFTFAATRNSVLAAGLRPVYADIDPHDWTLDCGAVARVLAERSDVAALLPVTVFGVPPDLAALKRLARQHGCALVLDDAHGLGTVATGTDRDPAVCDARALSLHATKTVVAGEGGALLLRDPQLVDAARELANHGIRADGRIREMGWNFKLPELSATVARHSLRTLTDRVQRRRSVADRLMRALGRGAALQAQAMPAGLASNFQNFGALVRGAAPGARDAWVERFSAQGVEARRYFWPTLAPAVNGAVVHALPVTAHVGERILCLPLHDGLDDSAATALIATVQALCSEADPWNRAPASP
ncbi:MAG: aminotransferase class I/II-fold pyridoxal phosphate-dependent enzyme [Deltaproteobacteria bacterium]|nr:aminotransferase class I/II-fold pyridoxal phosphate-dependent enzyme [Deltaproteobacteria bacterium]